MITRPMTPILELVQSSMITDIVMIGIIHPIIGSLCVSLVMRLIEDPLIVTFAVMI